MGGQTLILGEEHYFVWDHVSQSTKQLCVLKIKGGMSS